MAGIRKETMPTLEQTKICCHCKKSKSFDLFNNDKSKTDGKAVTCKECRSKQQKVLRAKNPEKYYFRSKKWRDENKEFYADWMHKHRHGISKQDVTEIVKEQNGCKICGTRQPSGDGRWHIDHDHSCCSRGSCNKCRRGVLCNFCNSMIGFAKEDIEILYSAINYLKEYGKEK